MLIVYSRNRIPIRLTEERWRHIVNRHVEMIGQRERVLEAVAEPEMIQQGDFGELLAVRFYTQTPLTSTFIVVAYREVNLQEGTTRKVDELVQYVGRVVRALKRSAGSSL